MTPVVDTRTYLDSLLNIESIQQLQKIHTQFANVTRKSFFIQTLYTQDINQNFKNTTSPPKR